MGIRIASVPRCISSAQPLTTVTLAMLRFLISMLALAASLCSQTAWYACHLDGAHQVPPATTPASGWAVVRHTLANNSLVVYLHHDALATSATAAQLHAGLAGQNGAALLSLSKTGINAWTGSMTLSAAQASLLAQDSLYLDVHSSAFPGGELRGQITQAKNTLLQAVLDGSQMSPPTNSFASGTAVAFLHQPQNRLCYLIDTAGINNATMAHIHFGAAGVNGVMASTAASANGVWCGVTDPLSDAEVALVLSDQIYADVHTAAFPGGEIRGQLRIDLGSCFTATCRGSEEVPPNASTAYGNAQLLVAPDGQIELTGMFQGANLIAAHIHVGPIGTAGPILFPISWSNTTGEISATYQATPLDLAKLRSGLWYVNLHSAAFPGGELRGQLVLGQLAVSYGKGCQTFSGEMPEANLDGLATVGATGQFQLFGAAGCPLTVLCIGQDRTTGVPLLLPTIGIDAPGCHALTDVLLTQISVPDPNGLAQVALPIPLDPTFRGVPLTNQWLLLDPLGNAAGIAVSNGLAFTLH
jgi:hypothetical protein